MEKVAHDIADLTYTCIKNIASINFAFLPEFEDLSELRELSNLEGSINQAAGEEVDRSWVSSWFLM